MKTKLAFLLPAFLLLAGCAKEVENPGVTANDPSVDSRHTVTKPDGATANGMGQGGVPTK